MTKPTLSASYVVTAYTYIFFFVSSISSSFMEKIVPTASIFLRNVPLRLSIVLAVPCVSMTLVLCSLQNVWLQFENFKFPFLNSYIHALFMCFICNKELYNIIEIPSFKITWKVKAFSIISYFIYDAAIYLCFFE